MKKIFFSALAVMAVGAATFDDNATAINLDNLQLLNIEALAQAENNVGYASKDEGSEFFYVTDELDENEVPIFELWNTHEWCICEGTGDISCTPYNINTPEAYPIY